MIVVPRLADLWAEFLMATPTTIGYVVTVLVSDFVVTFWLVYVLVVHLLLIGCILYCRQSVERSVFSMRIFAVLALSIIMQILSGLAVLAMAFGP